MGGGKARKRTVDGEGAAELTHNNIVVNLSQHSRLNQAGITRTLTCSCSPTKAAQRSHQCHDEAAEENVQQAARATATTTFIRQVLTTIRLSRPQSRWCMPTMSFISIGGRVRLLLTSPAPSAPLAVHEAVRPLGLESILSASMLSNK